MLPVVGVSACLLGQHVRYDGRHKYTSLIVEELSKHCQLLAVCPEVGIGLGIPRPKIQLTQVGATIKVLQQNQADVDVTSELVDFAARFVKQHTLNGMVLQDKSPSCGIGNTPIYSESGKVISDSSGLFAATVIDLLPELPVIRASQLQSKDDVAMFVFKLSANLKG